MEIDDFEWVYNPLKRMLETPELFWFTAGVISVIVVYGIVQILDFVWMNVRKPVYIWRLRHIGLTNITDEKFAAMRYLLSKVIDKSQMARIIGVDESDLENLDVGWQYWDKLIAVSNVNELAELLEIDSVYIERRLETVKLQHDWREAISSARDHLVWLAFGYTERTYPPPSWRQNRRARRMRCFVPKSISSFGPQPSYRYWTDWHLRASDDRSKLMGRNPDPSAKELFAALGSDYPMTGKPLDDETIRRIAQRYANTKPDPTTPSETSS